MEKQKNRWVILIACIVINLCLGAGYAWSVFQKPLMEQFGWTPAQASLAFSISFAMVPIAMIIFGPRQDKEGPRKITFMGGLAFGLGMIATGFVKNLTMLYITYGLILGFGIGMGYGCTTATTVKWFPDKKGLAGGLTAAGFGLGAVIIAPLAVKLIGSMGVLTTFKVLGAALLVIICVASMVLSSPVTATSNATVSVSTLDKRPGEMMKTGAFKMLWLVYLCGCLAGMMIIGHAANIASLQLGADVALATLTVSLMAVANTGGRIVWGSVSDKIGRYNTVIAMFINSMVGLALLTFTGSQSLGIVGILLIALSFGGFLGIYPGITAENWGAKFNGSNYGYMFTAYGVAAVFGPRMAATMFDPATGSFGKAFTASIALSLVGIVLMVIFKTKMNKRKLNA